MANWWDDGVAETQRRQQAAQQSGGTAAAPNVPYGNAPASGIPGQGLVDYTRNWLYVNGQLGGAGDGTDGFGGMYGGRGLGGFGSGIVGADALRGAGSAAVTAEQNKLAAQQNAAAAQGSRFGALGNEAARQQDQARAQQMALIKQIQDQAAGRGPSLAQAQLQQANEAAARQAMALGYSQRGAGAAGALKSIREQQAGMTQQNAADSAMLRLQEQLQARQMLGGLLGGMRGQDIGNMQWGLGNQASLGMQQAGLDLARDNSYRQDRLGWEQARQGQAGIDYKNSFMGNLGTILGGISSIGNMIGGGLEAYGQIKKADNGNPDPTYKGM